MDNKITKKRFADFLSYEWILITVIILVAILVWEVIFTLFSVKLTDGQKFKVLYDQEVDYEHERDLITTTYSDQKAFSYDVLELSKEALTHGIQNELGIRYETRDCDVIIATNYLIEEETGYKYTRADYVAENYNPWSYEKAVTDGDKYLEKLLNTAPKFKAGDIQKSYEYSDIDQNKVDQLFLTRQKKDNRFRSDEEKAQGKIYERQRIEKICKEISYAKRLLNLHSGEDGIFYTYAIGQQYFNNATESEKANALKVINQNKQHNLELYGKEILSYGIKLDKLSGGVYRPAEFFTSNGKCENLVLLAFDFIEDQPDLQFESLFFMNTVVRMCSGIL